MTNDQWPRISLIIKKYAVIWSFIININSVLISVTHTIDLDFQITRAKHVKHPIFSWDEIPKTYRYHTEGIPKAYKDQNQPFEASQKSSYSLSIFKHTHHSTSCEHTHVFMHKKVVFISVSRFFWFILPLHIPQTHLPIALWTKKTSRMTDWNRQ